MVKKAKEIKAMHGFFVIKVSDMKQIYRAGYACLIWLLFGALVWSIVFGGCRDKPEGPGDGPVDTCDTCQPVDTCEGDTCEPSDTTEPPTVDTLDNPDDCPPPADPDTLDCQPNPCQSDIVSNPLLNNPVYSPIDNCVYYEDTGFDSAYFEWFRRNPCQAYHNQEVPRGIYRLKLDDESPAELIGLNGFRPSISPDGTTLYYNIGYWGGPIMKVTLPNGMPELVREGGFIQAFYYSPDTLVVATGIGGGFGTWFLDLKTDSLHRILINGSLSDVSANQRILTSHAHCGGTGNCLGICDSSGIWYSGPLVGDVRDGHWNPSGQLVVFGAFSETGSEIRITDLEGSQRILAFGGGPDYKCLGVIMEPQFASIGQEIIYIQHTTPIDYDPCRRYEHPVQDGQIWIMSAADGSNKRQVSTWSRIRP